ASDTPRGMVDRPIQAPGGRRRRPSRAPCVPRAHRSEATGREPGRPAPPPWSQLRVASQSGGVLSRMYIRVASSAGGGHPRRHARQPKTVVMTSDTTAVALPLDAGWSDIREGVRRICDGFPNEYWVKLDHEAAYPTEFVRALTEAGYLAALIPEEYGGSG